MCGIFLAHRVKETENELNDLFNKIKHRGPDYSKSFRLDNTYYGFHRLAIINPDSGCDQPYINYEEDLVVMCNGEIYNWRELSKKFNIPINNSTSDCWVIRCLYEKIGFTRMVQELEGEFAIIIHDIRDGIIYACRDICGTRPLYYAYSNGQVFLSSELKSIQSSRIFHIRPRNVYKFYDNKYDVTPYWDFPINFDQNTNISKEIMSNIYKELYEILYESIEMRLESDRDIGFFLSGGIDSSIICAIAQRIKPGIKCFTIGMDDSPDVIAAKEVAAFLNVDLTVIPFNILEAIDDLSELIWHLETYDITTIRASAAQFAACKWISKNTDIKVLFSGEVADELWSSYLYFKYSPSTQIMHNEAIRLLSEIHYFDALRLDRCCASQGLECRVPYMNRKYIEYVLQLNADLRRCDNNIEKLVIRSMAESFKLLPQTVIYRQKNAFSDGVSGKTNWITALKKYALETFCDINFIDEMGKYNYLSPETLEQLLYRRLFDLHFPGKEHILPHFWMPKWCNTKDPSASTLDVFNNE